MAQSFLFEKMASEQIILEVSYLPKDIRKGIVTKGLSALIISALFQFIAICILYLVASRYLTETISGTLRVFLLVFIFACPLISVAVDLITLEYFVRARARRIGTVTLSIDETGIRSSEENRSAKLDWKAYKRAVEFKDKFEIITVKGGGVLIPKRCFDSNESIQAFRELVSKGLNKAVETK